MPISASSGASVSTASPNRRMMWFRRIPKSNIAIVAESETRHGRCRAIMARVIGRVSSPTFVGRREELRALADAVSAAAAGSGSVVLVSGEPGIGKSRLISEFAAGSDAPGAIVLVGECPPLGHGDLPYAPIITVLRLLGRMLQQADPGRARTEADRAPDRAHPAERADLAPDSSTTARRLGCSSGCWRHC